MADLNACFLCGRGAQPCQDCGAGLPVCEPCIRGLEALRCHTCQAAVQAGVLKVMRMLMHCYRMRQERAHDADLWRIDTGVYADDESAWE